MVKAHYDIHTFQAHMLCTSHVYAKVHNMAGSLFTSFSIYHLAIGGLEAQKLCFGHIFGLIPFLLEIMKWQVTLLALNMH